MALKLYERYPQLWESPSNDYPQGAFKNLSAQGETDGSYLEKDWLNDYSGFFGALLRNAEMTPDGTVDTAQRSQFYDALVKVAKESVDLSAYRKKDDLLFKGMLEVQATDDVSAGVSLQDTDGTVRGSLVSNSNGIQITQVQGEGSEQSFTFPSEGSGGEIVTDRTLLESVPIGVVKAYVGETAPNDKWLLCRGQAFSAESYPALAQLLPDLKIPDLRGVALRGLDANRGYDPNRKLLSYQEDAMQKITGSFVAHTYQTRMTKGAFYDLGDLGARQGIYGSANYDNYRPTYGFDSSLVTRTNTQNETVMKNVAVNFIIKAR